jgi:ABC-type multidrug transport system fused ATPase/permease subunit
MISAILVVSYLIIFFGIRNYLSRMGDKRVVLASLGYKYVNEMFGGIKDIKILGKEKVFLNLLSDPFKNLAMNDAMSDSVTELPKYFLETIVFSGILGTIVFMIYPGRGIETFLPILTVYAFGTYRLLPALQKIFKAISSIKYHFPIVKNLNRDFIGLPDGEALSSEEIPAMPFNNTIHLENIVFQYPNTGQDIIKNQSIAIAANTSIAMVGYTGCGKTTFVDIILGLLEPQGGKIIVDNTEIIRSNKKSWQRNLGYVPQSIYLTDDTIRHNIAFGIEPDKINDNAVIRAAKLANIHDFITTELEKGYETFVGERGIRLSGGQRQRIGIARAVYHDPSVLILDEATSALDSLTENAIIDAINNLSHKKTIIMIAHRITTVKACDIIYLMDRGIIVDQGHYDELYERNSVFKKMADGI